MNSVKTFAACCALAGLVAGGAWAAGSMDRDSRRAEHLERMFEMFDDNKDGVIDAAERAEALKSPFERMDANADGKLTAEEMKAGAVKRAEMMAERRFARLDANGDGAVDADEMAAARARRDEGRHDHGHGHHAMMGDGDGGCEGGRHGRRHAEHRERRGDGPRAGWFERVDADGDGVITKEEAEAFRPGRMMAD